MIVTELQYNAKRLLDQYLNLPFKKNRVPCPYWMNLLDKNIKGPYSGKGTPRQIVACAYRIAKSHKINLDTLSKDELTCLLKEYRLGIDCSGFVFHLLNSIYKENHKENIADILLPNNTLPGWRAVWRCSASRLTSDDYSTAIQLDVVQAGDMIKTMGGSHVMIITEVNEDQITYAHSSYLSTKLEGVHLGVIKIDASDKDIKEQYWQEMTSDNKAYNRKFLLPGDGFRRPKWATRIY